MKQFNHVKRGQALLFVFFLLLMVGILAGALAVVCEAEIKTRSLERDGLIAFYLAQAGIEGAKIELINNPSWDPNLGTFYNLPLLGIEWGCAIDVISVGGQQRDIICRGGKRKSTVIPWSGTEELEIERRIKVRVQGIGAPPASQVPWTWQEI